MCEENDRWLLDITERSFAEDMYEAAIERIAHHKDWEEYWSSIGGWTGKADLKMAERERTKVKRYEAIAKAAEELINTLRSVRGDG